MRMNPVANGPPECRRSGVISALVLSGMIGLTASAAFAKALPPPPPPGPVGGVFYGCVKADGSIYLVAAPAIACKAGELATNWNAVGQPGLNAPPPEYGVGAVNVKRGGGTVATWARYSTPLGSPLGADLTNGVGGDTAGGTFRFTCSTTHGVCEVSVAAATLSTTAGATVYVYPRVLIQRQDYNTGGPQTYCEYGDGSTGAIPVAVPTQLTTTAPVYTPMQINIGGSADCSGPVAVSGFISISSRYSLKRNTSRLNCDTVKDRSERMYSPGA